MRIFLPFFHLACLCALATALSITDRFNVDVTSKSDGGCGWVGEQNLTAILNECLTLAETGIKVVDDYSTSPEAVRILESFFTTGGLKLTPSDLNEIKDKYTEVRDWIKNGGPVDGGQSNNKPLLFCHHTWLQKCTMADVARHPDGSDVEKIDSSGQIVKMLIRDNQKYVDAQRDEQADLRARCGPKAIAVPYWSKKLGVYIFDDEYRRRPGYGFCSNFHHRAATLHATPNSTITLCPTSFGTVNSRLSNNNIIKVRSIKPVPVKKANAGTQSAVEIKTYTPTSATLFHELFHLVLGHYDTVPHGGEIYGIAAMLQADFQHASENAETFTVVAVGYDYTLNSGQDASGNKVEFFTGYATQG